MTSLCDLKYKQLSSSSELTIQQIEEHINEPWNWIEISKNPIIISSFVRKYHCKFVGKFVFLC